MANSFFSKCNLFIVLVLVSFIIHSNTTIAQTTRLWGMSQYGGMFEQGNLFSFDSVGNDAKNEFSFFDGTQGALQGNNLYKSSNGLFYGGISTNGIANESLIFEFDPVNGIYNKKAEFSGVNGLNPSGEMVDGVNGKIYGTTTQGGTNNQGVIFEYDPILELYVKKIDFQTSTSGSGDQHGMVGAANGKLYGTHPSGGSNSLGTLYEYDPLTNIYMVIINFDGSTNGSVPKSKLITASNGLLYGTTTSGGANGYGIIFEFDPISSILVSLFDFDVSSGSEPSTLYQAANDSLYGVCKNGGALGFGSIYAYDIATDSHIVLHDFQGGSSGQTPNWALVQDSNGLFYGIAANGSSLYSIIYSLDPATSAFNILQNLDQISTGYGYVTQPLIENDVLYATTGEGGLSLLGCFFTFDISTSTFDQIISLTLVENGHGPTGNIIQADNEKLYGCTQIGGTNNLGTLWEYTISTKTAVNKVNFNGAANGSNPTNSLLENSTGKIYGLTSDGGSNGVGVLFKYLPSSSSVTNMHNFSSIADGGNPKGHLIEASNGKLYGLTEFGGTSGAGTIFEFDTVSNILTKLYDFDGLTNGGNPTGGLLEATNGKLYGLTQNGGTGDGVVFEYDIVSNTYTKLQDFSIALNGGAARGSFIEANNGKLYALCSEGGLNGDGTLVTYDYSLNVLTNIYDFNSPITGAQALGDLIEEENNVLYFLTQTGGANGLGTLCEYDINTSTFTKKWDFDNSAKGKSPLASLSKIEGCFDEYSTVIYETVCQGELYTFPDLNSISNISQDTIHISYLLTVSGCDSLITSNVTVTAFDTTVVKSGFDFTAIMATANYQWLDCNNSYAIINGETSQTFTADSIGSFSLEIQSGACIDTTNCQSISNQDFYNLPGYDTLQGYVFVLPVSALGTCDGLAFAAAFNGIAPYQFDWFSQASNDFSDILDTVCDGIHTLKITDFIGDSLILPYYIPDSANYQAFLDTTLFLNCDTITLVSENCNIDYSLPIDSIDFTNFTFLYIDPQTGGEYYLADYAYYQMGNAYLDSDTIYYDNTPGCYLYQFSIYCPTRAAGEIKVLLIEGVHPSTLSLDENEAINWAVYPNPFDNYIQIKFDSFHKNETIKVINLLGQKVFEFEITGVLTTVNLGYLPAGMYILEKSDGTGLSQLKVLKR